MRLTAYTDYSLRVLIFAAVHADRRVTIPEIAAAMDISRNHLMKIVHNLGLNGFLETSRGKNGGMKLARPADRISLGAVIRAMEPDFAIAPCLVEDSGSQACVITPACRLKFAFRKAIEAFIKSFDEISLADITANPEALTPLLSARAER
jgi:Rrf2 family nitric oxide-sensitive transcriptional repressor